MTPEQMASYFNMLRNSQSMGMAPVAGGQPAIPSDVFAAEQMRKAEVERTKAEAVAEAERKAREQLEKELAARDRAMLDMEHKFELKLMEQRLAISASAAAPKGQSTADMIQAFAPFVPVLVALVQGSKESSSKAMEMQLGGMHRIAEKNIENLNAAQLKNLVRHGTMARIYVHLLSLEHFAKLLDRKAAQAKPG